MREKLIICALTLVLGLMTIPAFAQQYGVDVHPPDDVMDTELTIGPGEQFCFDVYLTGATLGNNPGAGGVYIDYTSSIGLVSYVSATDAVPPWTAGPMVNEPEGPGTFWTKVLNLGRAIVSDGAGNILVTTMCFDCIGEGDVEFDLRAAVDPSYWPVPYD